MKRRYIYGSKLWQKENGDLRFGNIASTLSGAKEKNKNTFKPVINAQKLVNGYWETVKTY